MKVVNRVAAALVGLALSATMAGAQTQAGPVQAALVSSLPATCSPTSGRTLVFLTVDSFLYRCKALNTWEKVGDALTAGTLAQFAATSSSQLAGVLSDETGSGGGFVRATSPTITSPTIEKLANLTTNGFVKTSGGDGTLSVDTSTYLTAAVTSVAMTVPSILSVSGSPITSTGTLAVTLASQSANTVFAAPDGSAGTPTFRSLVAADIPSLSSVYLPLAGGTLTGLATVSRAGIGATSTDGIALSNGTAAAAGAQQWSPRLRLTGQGWKTTATAASQTVDWIVENQPVQGTTAPTSNLVFSSQVNAGGYSAAATLTSAGVILLPSVQNGRFLAAVDATTTGFGAANAGGNPEAHMWVNGTAYIVAKANAVALGNNIPLIVTSNAANPAPNGASLYGPAGDILEQRRSTNAQTFRLYNTYTDASNGEWASFKWSGNEFLIGQDKNGTGSNRVMKLMYGSGSSSYAMLISSTATSVQMIGVQASAAINGMLSIGGGYASGTALTGTHTDVLIAPSSAMNGANNTGVYRVLAVTPTINYSNATPGAGSYEALKIAVTETALPTGTNYLIRASAGAAGATDKFAVNNAGAVLVGGAIYSVAGGGIGSGANFGPGTRHNNSHDFSIGSSVRATLSGTGPNGFVVGASYFYGWSSSSLDATAPLDLALYRDAANTAAWRNGTYAQTFNVYETYTDASNYSRIALKAQSASYYQLIPQAAGTGTLRGLQLVGASGLLGFYGATPVARPTTAGAAATRVAGAGASVLVDDTYDGYTVAQVVKALRTIGVLQ